MLAVSCLHQAVHRSCVSRCKNRPDTWHVRYWQTFKESVVNHTCISAWAACASLSDLSNLPWKLSPTPFTVCTTTTLCKIWSCVLFFVFYWTRVFVLVVMMPTFWLNVFWFLWFINIVLLCVHFHTIMVILKGKKVRILQVQSIENCTSKQNYHTSEEK